MNFIQMSFTSTNDVMDFVCGTNLAKSLPSCFSMETHSAAWQIIARAYHLKLGKITNGKVVFKYWVKIIWMTIIKMSTAEWMSSKCLTLMEGGVGWTLFVKLFKELDNLLHVTIHNFSEVTWTFWFRVSMKTTRRKLTSHAWLLKLGGIHRERKVGIESRGWGPQVGWVSSTLSTYGDERHPDALRFSGGTLLDFVSGTCSRELHLHLHSQPGSSRAAFGHDHGSSVMLRPHRPPPPRLLASFLTLPDDHRNFWSTLVRHSGRCWGFATRLSDTTSCYIGKARASSV